MIGKLKVLVFVYMHVCKPDPDAFRASRHDTLCTLF